MLSNKPRDISHLVADPRMQMRTGEEVVEEEEGYCASGFIWTDQKHNYALLAHNKPKLSELENSFIYISPVAVWQ